MFILKSGSFIPSIFFLDYKFSIDASHFSITDDSSDQKLLKKQRSRTRTRYVIGGFVYHNKLVAGKNPIRYLACAEMKRAGCRARAILPVFGSVEQLRITKPHNHPPDEHAEEREEFITHLRDAARSMPGSLKKIYDTIASLYPNGAGELPFKSVCSSLHRWRRITDIFQQDQGKGRKKVTRSRFVVNGFVYHTSVVRTSPAMRYLICSKYASTGCHARAILPLNGAPSELRVTRSHNHPPDETAEDKHTFFKQLKEVTRATPNGSLKMLYEAVISLYPQISAEVSFDSIRTSMRRWRKEAADARNEKE